MRRPNHFRGRALLAIALIAAIVMSVVPAESASASPPQETHARGADHGRIAVVPLDDRPVNMYAPQVTAKVAGFPTDFPPRSILGHFTTPGDGAAVARWLTAQDRADVRPVHQHAGLRRTHCLAYCRNDVAASGGQRPSDQGATGGTTRHPDLRLRHHPTTRAHRAGGRQGL